MYAVGILFCFVPATLQMYGSIISLNMYTAQLAIDSLLHGTPPTQPVYSCIIPHLRFRYTLLLLFYHTLHTLYVFCSTILHLRHRYTAQCAIGILHDARPMLQVYCFVMPHLPYRCTAQCAVGVLFYGVLPVYFTVL